MLTRDFYYELPEQLIAQFPLPDRTASRLLMVAPDGRIRDTEFPDILTAIDPGDLLVINNTKVLAARLFGRKATGGKVEVLIERLLDSRRALALVRASKTPRAGTHLILGDEVEARVIGRDDDLFQLELEQGDWLELLESCGHMPLPPYIQRPDEASDLERYQTVFGQRPGAVAAPTAGLHFDQPILERMQQKGVEIAEVTLHVGAGTFQPVRVEKIEDHQMHAEWLEVSADTCEKIRATKAQGGRVIAVGTTAVRSLETAALGGELKPFSGDSRLFITPGFDFHVVDVMITNFHLPESTLLMLVCAFGGYEPIMTAYHHAVDASYRFFSYGDAMWIERQREP